MRVISTLKGDSLKLGDKFKSLGSSISSMKNDINMRRTKAWTAFDRLSVIWKSDLFNKINRNFFPGSDHVHTTAKMHHMDAD